MLTTPKSLDQLLEPAEWDNLRSSMTPEWLGAVAETDRVRSLLAQRVSEFASGQLTLHDCEIKRLRLRDESGCWSGTYQLTIEGPTPGQQRIVPIRGTLIPPNLPEPAGTANGEAFGDEEWRCYLPELRLELETQSEDTGLPSLPQLTDPEQSRELLEASIRAGAENYRDLRIQASTPRVMRYKPGSRCTVLYDLEYPPDAAGGRNWPPLVVAKTYFGDKGRNAYEAMHALWNSPLAKSSAVTIAEPLAYLPELNVLLQGPIREETTLKEFLRSALHAGTPEAMEAFSDYMRKTAIGLAELHNSGVRYGELVTWEDELAEIRHRRDRLAVPIPQLADAADSLLAHLEELAADFPADPPLPSHRSFRPAQVLIYQEEIGFIDFDGFCQAEPALDLALFMVKIKHIALTKPGEDEEVALMDEATRETRLAQMEFVCELFLSEYEKHASVSRKRIMLWEALDVLSLVLGCWTKIKTQRLDNTIFMLERLLQANGLTSGLQALSQ